MKVAACISGDSEDFTIAKAEAPFLPRGPQKGCALVWWHLLLQEVASKPAELFERLAVFSEEVVNH